MNEIDSVLRKKLSLFFTGASPGLTINDNYFCHLYYLQLDVELDNIISNQDSEISRGNRSDTSLHAHDWIRRPILKPVLRAEASVRLDRRSPDSFKLGSALLI